MRNKTTLILIIAVLINLIVGEYLQIKDLSVEVTGEGIFTLVVQGIGFLVGITALICWFREKKED